jgi:HSP20 family protein
MNLAPLGQGIRRAPADNHISRGATMSMVFSDPVDVLLRLQRALEARRASDWLRDATTSSGPFPPVNVFQEGEDFVAIVELPGINKEDLQIEAKENTIRIAGKKSIAYEEGASVHRQERISGEFDRTLTIPVEIDPQTIKAEYRDGVLALFIPTAEKAKPRSIKIN